MAQNFRRSRYEMSLLRVAILCGDGWRYWRGSCRHGVGEAGMVAGTLISYKSRHQAVAPAYRNLLAKLIELLNAVVRRKCNQMSCGGITSKYVKMHKLSSNSLSSN
jgi:hypothetical protein